MRSQLKFNYNFFYCCYIIANFSIKLKSRASFIDWYNLWHVFYYVVAAAVVVDDDDDENDGPINSTIE